MTSEPFASEAFIASARKAVAGATDAIGDLTLTHVGAIMGAFALLLHTLSFAAGALVPADNTRALLTGAKLQIAALSSKLEMAEGQLIGLNDKAALALQIANTSRRHAEAAMLTVTEIRGIVDGSRPFDQIGPWRTTVHEVANAAKSTKSGPFVRKIAR